ncbi:hypothetical protein [Vibrio mediterranei]
MKNIVKLGKTMFSYAKVIEWTGQRNKKVLEECLQETLRPIREISLAE